MKKSNFFLMLLAFHFLFGACGKNEKEKVLVTRTQLLTNGAWVYDEYYTNYGQPNSTLVYKRGGPQDSVQLQQNRLTFKAGGTFEVRIQLGIYNRGTWRLKENDTLLDLTFPRATSSIHIIALSATHFTWHDPKEGTFAKMVPF